MNIGNELQTTGVSSGKLTVALIGPIMAKMKRLLLKMLKSYKRPSLRGINAFRRPISITLSILMMIVFSTSAIWASNAEKPLSARHLLAALMRVSETAPVDMDQGLRQLLADNGYRADLADILALGLGSNAPHLEGIDPRPKIGFSPSCRADPETPENLSCSLTIFMDVLEEGESVESAIVLEFGMSVSPVGQESNSNVVGGVKLFLAG